jgi:hypothetical protein
MAKGLKLLFNMVASIVLLTAISVCGCSDSSPEATDEQLAYLQDACGNMLEAASFTVAGDATMNADMGSETVDMQLGLEGAYEKNGEGSLAEMRMTAQMRSSKEGTIELAATAYLEDEYIYTTMDGNKWYYSDLTPVSSGVVQATNLNIGQFLPESIVALIDFAEEIQVIADDGESIEFELIMGRDFYNLQKKTEAEQNLGKSFEEFSPQEKQVVEMSVDMNVRYGSTSYFYTVDKSTRLIIEFGSTFGIDNRSSSGRMYASGEMWMRFSDFAQEFSITVPDEARGAEYMPPGSSIDL